jgi:tripartite-type tricarboxylate transporter receptor subunit TctC
MIHRAPHRKGEDMNKLKAALAAILLSACAGPATAQGYPTHPVKFVVPFPPGSGPDQVARVLQQQLQEILGQPFVVENRSGALGTVGAAEASRAAPDGYTILFTTNTTQAASVALFRKLQYDPVKDFTPVCRIIMTSMMLVVKADFPAANVKEFIAYAKSRQGGLNAGYGSAGTQVSIAKLKAGGGFQSVDVPYKGVPLAVNDVLAGQVDFTYADLAVGLAQIKGGKLKALGVTSAQRTPLAPEIPAIAETLPGYETTLWYGIMAPAGTPRDIVDKLHAAIARGMNKPDIKARFGAMGLDVAMLAPDPFGDYIKLEIAKWTREAKEANIQAE